MLEVAESKFEAVVSKYRGFISSFGLRFSSLFSPVAPSCSHIGVPSSLGCAVTCVVGWEPWSRFKHTKKALQKEVLLGSLLKFPGLRHKVADAKSSVSMRQNWDGTEGCEENGVRGAPLLLLELELLLPPAAPAGSSPPPCQPGHLWPWSLWGGGRWHQVTQGRH